MRRTSFVPIVVLLFWLFSGENNTVYSQTRFIDNKIQYFIKTPKTPGEWFTGGLGECVDFVKQSREDLSGTALGKVYYAGNMIKVAREKGYEVNELPRVGAVLVMPNIGYIFKSEEIKVPDGTHVGHVAIVTKVKKIENGIYTLTIRDANAVKKDRLIGDPKSGSLVDERQITYNVSDQENRKVVDPILGEQLNVAFIHEEKSKYKEAERAERIKELKKEAAEAQAEAERLASFKEQFIETLKGIPKAFDDLEHGRLKGTLPQTLYDVSTSLLQTVAAVTPGAFSLSLSDLEKMKKTLDATRSIAHLDPGHPGLNVSATDLTSSSTTSSVVEAEAPGDIGIEFGEF